MSDTNVHYMSSRRPIGGHDDVMTLRDTRWGRKRSFDGEPKKGLSFGKEFKRLGNPLSFFAVAVSSYSDFFYEN